MTDARYPIGHFEMPTQVTPARRQQAMDEIASLPAKMRAAVKGLNDTQLDTPYRSGGWTVRQVVHHVPDSHLNAYVRLKLALTEERPTIKPYDEDAWSKLADSKSTPIEVSFSLLTAIHDRWDRVCRSLKLECSERWMSGSATLPLRMAREASHRAHHGAAQAKRLVNKKS